jgi:hypothetical protein
MPSKLTTPEIIDRLRRRYPESSGAWANVVEFERIDFLAVATWQSKGFDVHGHEIKASRSDWLRELKKPGKAIYSMARCDYWWLVAPRNVARPEEIPHGWGFIEVGVNGCKVIHKAPRLRPALNRERFTVNGPNHEFWAREAFAMLARRYAYSTADRDAILDAVPDAQPYLDMAAKATGRVGPTIRAENREWMAAQARRRKENEKRIHDLLMRQAQTQ